jgi:hypothetical protein
MNTSPILQSSQKKRSNQRAGPKWLKFKQELTDFYDYDFVFAPLISDAQQP